MLNGRNRMSDYILTHSKIRFYPVKPVKEDIHIEDIAHALSLMTRANGHFRHFYSVAQHSLNCYRKPKAGAARKGYSWDACSMTPASVISPTLPGRSNFICPTMWPLKKTFRT